MTHKEYSDYLATVFESIFDETKPCAKEHEHCEVQKRPYCRPIPQYIKLSGNRCIVKWENNSVINVPVFPDESPYTAYCRALAYRSFRKTAANTEYPTLKSKEKIENATVFFWYDGTHTTVKLSLNDKYSEEEAFNAAFAKRIYGSNAAIHRLVDTHTVEYLNKQKQAQKEAKRVQAAADAELAHIRKVKKLAKELRLYDEAIKYNEALSNTNNN